MGISRLADVIKEEAAEAMSSFPLQQYRGHVIALDASIAIYQFRTAMPKIFNRNGENISHLQGLFYRTLHLLENGVLPVFVFDGRPPDLKQPLLARRAEAARARGDAAGSCLPASQQQPLRQDCETLLHYLGVPCVQAPAEAEATCAALVKSGRVWGTATEDMDALPFGSLRLIRHVNCKARGEVEEISLPAVLRKLGLTQEQFVDLCILLGCDYCGKIWRLGPKKALKLLQQHGTIEGVLQNIDLQKHPLPAHWDLEGARRLFLQPEVADPGQVRLEWRDPDVEGLVRFLAHEKHMNEVRVRRRLQKWREAQPAPGGAQPTPQAPGGAQPTPQAPGGAQPTPQAPGGAQPTPQAPGEAQPTPQAPGEAQPTPQAPGAGGRQWRLSDFFPASKQARALEAPGPRPSRKRQKRPVGSPEPGE